MTCFSFWLVILESYWLLNFGFLRLMLFSEVLKERTWHGLSFSVVGWEGERIPVSCHCHHYCPRYHEIIILLAVSSIILKCVAITTFFFGFTAVPKVNVPVIVFIVIVGFPAATGIGFQSLWVALSTGRYKEIFLSFQMAWTWSDL